MDTIFLGVGVFVVSVSCKDTIHKNEEQQAIPIESQQYLWAVTTFFK